MSFPRPRRRIDRRFFPTARERAVLRHLAEGLTSKEIAAQFGLSVITIDNHRAHPRKLGVSNTAAAIRLATRQGVIPQTNCDESLGAAF